LKDVFGGQVKTASELPEGSGKKPGTIGTKRSQRLYAIMNQNKAKTGLTHDLVHEILSKLPKPITSLSDLETGMHDEFERIVSGQTDWHELV